MISAMPEQPPPPGNPAAPLLAAARAAVEEKTRRGVYTPELRARLAEPLDMQPDPGFAAGPAWPEVGRTTDVTPDPPIISTRPVVGTAVRAAKGAVRRGLRWYLGPVTAQVTSHNRAVAEVLAEHNRQIVELRREVELLQRRLAETEGHAGPA
jgi:hypothetical protein